jgi:hypothetical protein
MAKDKKKSKGPKDRNSNYQMKNGNSVSRKKEKKPVAERKPVEQMPQETKSAASKAKSAKPAEKNGLFSGISSSISNATSSLSKMFKH